MTVIASQIPEVQFEVDPSSGNVGETFTASIKNLVQNAPNGAVLDWGDDSNEHLISDGNYTHRYRRPGTFTVTLREISQNTRLGQAVINVTASGTLTAEPTTATVGEIVTLTASDLAPDLTHRVDFGDGSGSTFIASANGSATVTHIYTSPNPAVTVRLFLSETEEVLLDVVMIKVDAPEADESLSYSELGVPAPEILVDFTAEGLLPDAEYMLTFGDGMEELLSVTSGKVTERYGYTEEGTYTAQLYLLTQNGDRTLQTSVVVNARWPRGNEALTLTTEDAKAETETVFEASNLIPFYGYEIDFGNPAGTVSVIHDASKQSTSFVYPEAGMYTAKLFAIYPDGKRELRDTTVVAVNLALRITDLSVSFFGTSTLEGEEFSGLSEQVQRGDEGLQAVIEIEFEGEGIFEAALSFRSPAGFSRVYDTITDVLSGPPHERHYVSPPLPTDEVGSYRIELNVLSNLPISTVPTPPLSYQVLSTSTRLAFDLKEFTEIPIPASLKEIIASGKQQQYSAYSFEAGRMVEVEQKFWSGLLLLPNPTETAQLVSLKVGRGSETLEDWWYRSEDGSLSKLILNSRGETAGIVTVMPKSSASVALDLDGDKVVDVLNIIHSNHDELLIVDEARGVTFMNEWLMGQEPLCLPGAMSTEQDVKATLQGCGENSSSGPGGGGSGSGNQGAAGNRRQDPLDKMCEEHAASRQPRSGVPSTVATLTKEEVLLCVVGCALLGVATGPVGSILCGTLVCGDLLSPSPAGDSEYTRENPTGEGTSSRERQEYHDTDGDGEPDAEDTDGDGEPDVSCDPCGPEGTNEGGEADGGGGSGGSGTSQPGVGPDGDPDQPDSEAAMDELCARRAEARNRHIDSMDDLDQRAADTDCDDPVVNPNPAEAQSEEEPDRDITCSPESEDNRVTDFRQLLGDDEGRRCGPTETPGPDGTCSGRGRSYDTQRGSLWIGMGDIVGFVPCREETCTPSDLP